MYKVDPTGHWQEGDELLPPDVQQQIRDLTDAWWAADNDYDREAIHQQAQALREANQPYTWNDFKSDVQYYAGKTSSGFSGGYNELVNSYGLGDAFADIGRSGADGYSKAVKGGLITTGKGGTIVAKRLVPGLNAVFIAEDAVTFGKGFVKGWKANVY